MPAKIKKATSKQKQVEGLEPENYLTQDEITHLVEVARKNGRYGERDSLMILFAYNHALRLADLCALSWDQVDLDKGLLQVKVSKTNRHIVHPLTDFERTMLGQLKNKSKASPAVFVTERGGPMTPSNFRKMISRVSELSGVDASISPHKLRHARASHLVEAGADLRFIKEFLGLNSIQNVFQYYIPPNDSQFAGYFSGLDRKFETKVKTAETNAMKQPNALKECTDDLEKMLSDTALDKS